MVLFFAVFCHQIIVFAHQSLIFASLVRIKLIESHFHLLVDACELILKCLCFLFDFFSLQKDFIKFCFEFIVLIFDVLVSNFNIFRPGVDPEFIQGKVIISQLSFKISDFVGEGLKSLLEFIIKLLFLVDVLGFGS